MIVRGIIFICWWLTARYFSPVGDFMQDYFHQSVTDRRVTFTCRRFYRGLFSSVVVYTKHKYYFHLSGTIQYTLYAAHLHLMGILRSITESQGLSNYIDIKANAKWYLKKLHVKGHCGMCLSVWGPLLSFDPIPPCTLYSVHVYTVEYKYRTCTQLRRRYIPEMAST
jgi:hypothetical protein